MTAAVLALLLSCTGSEPEPAATSSGPPPDVLLIVEDTLRADAVGAYGAPRPTTPQLDQVAAAGVRFARAISPGSWTWPAHASLFTGVGPWEHGARFARPEPGRTWRLSPMPFEVTMPREELPTLAERFAAAGYRTASVSGNVLIGPGLPQIVRGFEEARYHPTDAAVVADAVELLRDDDPRPLFLFVNLYGAHGPLEVQPVRWLADTPALQPGAAPEWLAPMLRTEAGRRIVDPYAPVPAPTATDGDGGGADPTEERVPILVADMADPDVLPPEASTLLRDLYDGEVARVDRHLHDLLTVWNDTGRQAGIVAVTSDHGEYWGERGLWDHGRTVYGPVVEVPLVVTAPGRLAPGRVVEDRVQTDQLYDTLLELAGVVPTAQAPRSLLRHSEDGAPAPAAMAAAWPDQFYARHLGPAFDQQYRLWWSGDDAVVLHGDGTVERFDTAADPHMLVDIAARDPADTAALVARARAEFPATAVETGKVEVDAETREQLEALGYVGE